MVHFHIDLTEPGFCFPRSCQRVFIDYWLVFLTLTPNNLVPQFRDTPLACFPGLLDFDNRLDCGEGQEV